jgi:hypothetical protein
LFAWSIDTGVNKPANITSIYTFDIDGTPYTQVNKPTNIVAFYSYDITKPTPQETDLNLLKYSGYLFNATPYGIVVYDDDLVNLGVIELLNVSCIGVNSEFLYIGTTNSGIYNYSINLVASGIFNQYSVFKQNESITSNFVRYLSCTDDYVLAATESGINRYDLSSDSWYKCYPEKEVTKCWQATDGSAYYVTMNTEGTFYAYGDLLYKIKLTDKTGPFGNQVNLIFNIEKLGYQGLYGSGYNLLFFDEEQNPCSFCLDKWDFDGNFDVWVDIPFSDVDVLYMVLSKDVGNQSDPESVFLLYDDFTDSNSGKWDVIESEDASGNLLFNGTTEIEFVDFYNSSSENPIFLGSPPSTTNNWNGDCTYMAMIFPIVADSTQRCVFTDNNYNDGILSFYYNRIIAKWDVGHTEVTKYINVQPNTWYHVAMTHERDDIDGVYITKLYVDGIYSGESQVTIEDTIDTYGPESRLVIGYNFIGLISEVQIYDYTLSESEIQAKMDYEPAPGDPGLVAYYKINQGESDVIYDYSGNERHSSTVDVIWTGFKYTDSELIQNYSDGYILSSGTVSYPCTIQQKINIYDVLGVSKIYGVLLYPPEEGVYWHYGNAENTFDIHHAGDVSKYYAPHNQAVIDEGILTVGFDFNNIEFSFKSATNYLVDSWTNSTYSTSNRKLRLFDQGYSSSFTNNLFVDPDACFSSAGAAANAIIDGSNWSIYNTSEKPIWWYDFGSEFDIVINKIVIKQGSGGYSFNKGKIYGSNNNIDFTLLYEFDVDIGYYFIDTYMFLQNTTVYRYIKLEYTGNEVNIGISDISAYGHYDNNQHLLSLFDVGRSVSVGIDWVKVIKFGGEKIGVAYVEEVPSKIAKRSELNVMYSINSNWTNYNVDYTYYMDDGVYINDIHVTNNTSIYGGNVIFLANSNGIMCIEEKRGDENNCRTKYYKNI